MAEADAPSPAPHRQEMGGKRAADANWIRTVPERQRAALPRSARQELRAVPAELPPRIWGAPPAPLPALSPRRGLGGGQAATAPRSQQPPPGGLFARGNARGASRRGGHRLRRRDKKRRHGPEVPSHTFPRTLQGNPAHLRRRRE